MTYFGRFRPTARYLPPQHILPDATGLTPGCALARRGVRGGAGGDRVRQEAPAAKAVERRARRGRALTKKSPLRDEQLCRAVRKPGLTGEYTVPARLRLCENLDS